jgi:thiamine-phosphate pyrophosphorylase
MKHDQLKPGLQQGLYVITDCVNFDTHGLLSRTGQILEAGVAALQYRDKTPDATLRLERAVALQRLCRRYNTVFLINDDVELAARIGADGVHVGREDAAYERCRATLGPEAIIGISCYNQLDLALLAQNNGADYVAFGSFYPTTTKNTGYRADVTLLMSARRSLAVPVVAIGGITPENGAGLVEAGADLLAVVSSVYASDTPQQAVAEFNALFGSGLGTNSCS